jgi:structural maintenance of chromosome 2
LYILDEVDAALDLSHTQNIGQMLRTHFKKSQFIVVSLKDGMFNNANVLFKTKFVDGLSTVRRFTQQQPEDKENGKKSGAAAAAAAAAAPADKGASKGAKGRAMALTN